MSTTEKNSDELIDECQGMVHALAHRIARALPRHVELDDLIGYGQLGLTQAARAFDSSRGVRFSTFAYYRIRGAIYDGVTEMLWFRRSPDTKIKWEQAANEVLQSEFAENSSTVSASLDSEVSYFDEIVSTLAVAFVASIGLTNEFVEKSLIDQKALSPLDELGGRELQNALRSIVNTLPTEERSLIQFAYFDGLNLQRTSERMGISKSWASRLHSKTLKKLAHSVSRLELTD